MTAPERRYQVFLQERPDSPHQDVGSVHASDPEMALQNGRDVFTRRGTYVSLWVVALDQIFSRTAEQLEAESPAAASQEAGELQSYCIFTKPKPNAAVTFLTEVQAVSPQAALQKARARFPTSSAFVWWVFPWRACTAADSQDDLLPKGGEKPFRESGYFRVISAMRQARHRSESDPSEL